MVIDTSALLAILLGEPEAAAFAWAISQDPIRMVSAVSALEAAIVIRTRKGPTGVRELDLLVRDAAITIVGLDQEQVLFARAAYERFGKGYDSAALNLGDCCTYALAHALGEPLLFKGNDFSKVDLTKALWLEGPDSLDQELIVDILRISMQEFSSRDKKPTEKHRELLRKALEEMPTRMRRCVYLRVSQKLKIRDIADVMGVSVDTVKAHLFQARHVFEAQLGDDFTAPDL